MAHPKDQIRPFTQGAPPRRGRGCRRRRRSRRSGRVREHHDPVGTGERAARRARPWSTKPVGPGGLPLPRTDNSVTWAVADDNQPIAEGTPVETGPLQVYNYPDYIYPALVAVRAAARDEGRDCDLQLGGRGDREAPSGQVTYDVMMGLSGSNIVSLIAQQLLAPFNHTLPAEPRQERLDGAAGPLLRPRQPLHGAVRRLGGRDRLAQRQGARGHRRAWTCPGTSSGSRRRGGARSGSWTTSATVSMPMQRDAMRAGHDRRPQHGGSGDRRQGGARPRAADRHLQHQGHDHGLPDAARGDDVAAPLVVG